MNLRDGIDKVVKEAKRSKFGDLLPVEGYKLTEPYDSYNDYFADDEPITHSEREFNLATLNDRNIYDYVRGNRKALYDTFRSLARRGKAKECHVERSETSRKSLMQSTTARFFALLRMTYPGGSLTAVLTFNFQFLILCRLF